MSEKPDEMPPSLEQTQAQLREGLESAKRLVERTRSLLNGEPEGEPT